MLLNRRILCVVLLVSALFFCAPLSAEGQFVRKIMTSKKEKILRDGSYYKGEMMLMRPHGIGERTYTDGTVYHGQFERGHRHGKGAMIYANGEKYEGEWSKDVRDGKGVYY